MIRSTFALLLLLALRLAAQTAMSESLARDMLADHNQVRAKVGVPALTWSPKLASVAQQWAEELVATGKFTHRPKSQYGENLFEIRGNHATPAQVVAEWAAEGKGYDAGSQACKAGTVCGHYTQLVWRNTKQLGCGMAHAGDRDVWVCNYDPAGNVVGERPY